MPDHEAAMDKIERVPFSGCWVWMGTVANNGYGKIGKSVAHRIFYEQEFGPVPEGLQLDHLCRNRLCVNPAHLEPVTQRENIMRGTSPTAVNARKTHCIRGHEYTTENTYIRSNGYRMCRACDYAFTHSEEHKRKAVETTRKWKLRNKALRAFLSANAPEKENPI